MVFPGPRKGIVSDLRGAYLELLLQGISFDIRLLQESLNRLARGVIRQTL
jgi:hypothetical protein